MLLRHVTHDQDRGSALSWFSFCHQYLLKSWFLDLLNFDILHGFQVWFGYDIFVFFTCYIHFLKKTLTNYHIVVCWNSKSQHLQAHLPETAPVVQCNRGCLFLYEITIPWAIHTPGSNFAMHRSISMVFSCNDYPVLNWLLSVVIMNGFCYMINFQLIHLIWLDFCCLLKYKEYWQLNLH